MERVPQGRKRTEPAAIPNFVHCTSVRQLLTATIEAAPAAPPPLS